MIKYEYAHLMAPTVRFTLPCGLTVFVVERPTQSAHVELCFDVGSLDDGEAFGLSHMVEHLVFEGPARQGVHPKLRSLTLEGVESGASVGYNFTRYWVEGFGVEIDALLEALLAIAFMPQFDAKSLEGERGPILQELEENGSGSTFTDVINSRLFPAIPQIHCPSIGTAAAIRAISLKQVEEHHASFYRPENAALIIASGLAPDSVIGSVMGSLPYFGRFARAPRRIREALKPEPFSLVHMGPSISDRIIWFFPDPSKILDRVRFGLAFETLCTPPFGVLHAALRTRSSVIYGARSHLESFPISLEAVTVPCPKQAFDAVEAVFWNEVKSLAEGRVDSDAFRSAMGRRRRFFVERREAKRGILLGLRLDWLRGKVPDLDHERMVMATSKQDIADAAAAYITGARGSRMRHVME